MVNVKVDMNVVEDLATQEVIRRLRAELPGQHLSRLREHVSAQYGLPLPIREIHRRIRRTIPWKLFAHRNVWTWMVREYEGDIPDRALLRLHEAQKSGVFRKFTVCAARYGKQPVVARDPWLIGWTIARWDGIANGDSDDQGIVLASWD